MRRVSLTKVSQEFAKLVKEGEYGEGFVITRRGRPIAKLVPHSAGKATDPAWTAAYRRMMARLEEGAFLGGLRVERQDFYGQ